MKIEILVYIYMWDFFRMPNTAESLERHHSPCIYEEIKHLIHIGLILLVIFEMPMSS